MLGSFVLDWGILLGIVAVTVCVAVAFMVRGSRALMISAKRVPEAPLGSEEILPLESSDAERQERGELLSDDEERQWDELVNVAWRMPAHGPRG